LSLLVVGDRVVVIALLDVRYSWRLLSAVNVGQHNLLMRPDLDWLFHRPLKSLGLHLRWHVASGCVLAGPCYLFPEEQRVAVLACHYHNRISGSNTAEEGIFFAAFKLRTTAVAILNEHSSSKLGL